MIIELLLGCGFCIIACLLMYRAYQDIKRIKNKDAQQKDGE